jgi:formylglycine-generating enzyme
MRWLRVFLLILTISCSLFASRKALVIGNGAYQEAPLKNPVNDAGAVSTALSQLGFVVTKKTNLDQQEMDDAINQFTTSINKGDEILFYYSGHGAQANGENYLIPVDSKIESETNLKYHALSCSEIVDMLQQKAAISIIVLDACRDNPYRGIRSGSKGLAQISTKFPNQYIIYSTAPGKTATDGNGSNSPFTLSFVRNIASDKKITDIMQDIAKDVYTKTNGTQVPWSEGVLLEDFYFTKNRPVPSIKPIEPPRLTPQLAIPKDLHDDMVFVEGGSFTMGDTAGGGHSDEKPTHQVTLSSFYMGKYEVTQKQWQEVMGNNPSHFKSDNRPVEMISWYDCVEFCNKLSQKKDLTPCYNGSGENITCNWNANGYRLPTEAEWEYAAKGGKQGRDNKYSGSSDLKSIAWYYDNSHRKPHPVGKKLANEKGLFDMSGNVDEWCWDLYDTYSSDIQNNPHGTVYRLTLATNLKRGFPYFRTKRVLRGGSWCSDATVCTVSYRYVSNSAGSTGGFRLCRISP